MGTNDAWGGGNENVAKFKQNLQLVIDSCKARGIQPIIARVLATNPAITKWQVHPDFQKAVDELTRANKLIKGPDLYTWFLAHPEQLNGESDGVHPNAIGAASIQKLWAEKMAFLYGGCPNNEITPYLKINNDKLNIIASANLKQNDTLIISPQVNGTGTWSWKGPDDFSSKMREIRIDKIKIKQAGKYVVIFINTDNCFSTYTFNINVEKKENKLIINNHE